MLDEFRLELKNPHYHEFY